ncbi:hypothetical protein [Terasakiella sp. SH-1]|uniref:hypothetical protein n=1 Tax=Terasakiella sp. SH-1 TaxID=2560057 RepID=UPI0010739EC2|nr:hypothetical protein [Terasakiella sp. SH-1]
MIFYSLYDQIGTDLIQNVPDRIRIIPNTFVGGEQSKIEACRAGHIMMTKTRGLLTDNVVELVLLLLLAVVQMIFKEIK